MIQKIRRSKTQPTWFFEDQFQGYHIAGIDEAGCGPWAGPLVAAAAIINRAQFPLSILNKLNDSKKLSSKVRQELFQELALYEGKSFFYGIGVVEVEEIDLLNIGQATKVAMTRACQAIPLIPQVALVDGIRRPDLSTIHPSLTPYMIKQGDQKSYSIALASIIAKVTRDNIMTQLHAQYPNYKWDHNAGYGTQAHQDAIEMYGVTPYHRRSFNPIKRYLDKVS